MGKPFHSRNFGKSLKRNRVDFGEGSEKSSAKVDVEASSEFLKNLKALKKNYPNVRNDVEPITKKLQNGEIIGDQVTGTGYPVFKVRVENSDIQRGKSQGYFILFE